MWIPGRGFHNLWPKCWDSTIFLKSQWPRSLEVVFHGPGTGFNGGPLPPPPSPPKKRYVLLQSINGTLFGRRVFVDVTKDLEMRSAWMNQVSLKSSDAWTHVPTWKGNTKRRKHCLEGGRDWGNASTSPGPPEAGRGDGTASPSEPPEGTSPAHTFNSDFWSPELWEDTFLLS